MNPGPTNDVVDAIKEVGSTGTVISLNQRVPNGSMLASTSTFSSGGSATDPVSYGGFLISQFANATTQQTSMNIKRIRIYVANAGPVSIEEGTELVKSFNLEQNYPNPFNPSTVVGFQLSVAGQATLKVYDLLGREVAVLVNGVLPAGAHSATFDATNLPSGVYMYKLEAGGQSSTKRMTLVK
jgi:hypothetical protein